MLGHFDAADGNPKITLKITGTKQSDEIVALFDTGHNGSISLPILQLIKIGAVLSDIGKAEFADGYSKPLYYFTVKVTIDGVEKEVLASMIENPECEEAIAGLELFAPYIAVIDFKKKKIQFIKEEDLKKS